METTLRPPKRRHRRGAAREHEWGFGLIEMMVSLLILAIVMAVLGPALFSSLINVQTSNQRSSATGLAVAAIEHMRSIPYYDVGFYADQTLSSGCTSLTPVVLGTTTPPSGAALVPVYTKDIQSTPYTVSQCINWVNASNGDKGAYKQGVVTVTWKGAAGAQSLAETSALYPGGKGVYTGPDNNFSSSTTVSTAAVAPDPPTGVSATVGSGSTDTNTITVSWTPPGALPAPASDYRVQYNTTDDFAAGYASSPLVAGTSWTAGALTAGTTYYFQVISIGSTGLQSTPSTPVASASTASSSSSGCSVSSLSVSPTNGVIDTAGTLLNGDSSGGFSLAVNATSACADITVSYTTDGTTATQSSPLSGTGGQFTGSAGDSSTVWSAGNQVFTVYVGGAQYSPLTQQQVSICEEHGSSGKC